MTHHFPSSPNPLHAPPCLLGGGLGHSSPWPTLFSFSYWNFLLEFPSQARPCNEGRWAGGHLWPSDPQGSRLTAVRQPPPPRQAAAWGGVSRGRGHAEQKPRWESQATGDVRETSAPLGEPRSVRRTSCQQPAPRHGQCLGREVTPGAQIQLPGSDAGPEGGQPRPLTLGKPLSWGAPASPPRPPPRCPALPPGCTAPVLSPPPPRPRALRPGCSLHQKLKLSFGTGGRAGSG